MYQNLVILVSITTVLISGFSLATFLGSDSKIVFAQIPFIASSSQTNATTSTSKAGMSTPAELNLTNATGDIASLQNNATGKPTWLVIGKWNMSIPMTGSSLPSSQSNHTDAAMFNASFQMIKLDGTEKHKHKISNFKLMSSPTNYNIKSATFIGAATITLKDGVHNGVPITIKILNKGVISITPDSAKVNGHFGNTPIYGIVWRTH
jgi:hypothetical protein